MTTAHEIARQALELFKTRHGEFCKHNRRHIQCAADCVQDAYLDDVRTCTPAGVYPAYAEIQAEFYKLTT